MVDKSLKNQRNRQKYEGNHNTMKNWMSNSTGQARKSQI